MKERVRTLVIVAVVAAPIAALLLWPSEPASASPGAVSVAIEEARGLEMSLPATEFGVFLAGLSPAEATAWMSAIPARVPLDAVTMIPGVGPGYVDSFTKSCTSAAAVTILPSATVSYTCQNASTTMVQVGDSTISDPGTMRDAPIHCATNCPSQEWGGAARQEYCRGDTDTTIYCRALVAVVSAP